MFSKVVRFVQYYTGLSLDIMMTGKLTTDLICARAKKQEIHYQPLWPRIHNGLKNFILCYCYLFSSFQRLLSYFSVPTIFTKLLLAVQIVRWIFLDWIIIIHLFNIIIYLQENKHGAAHSGNTNKRMLTFVPDRPL